MVTKGYLTSNGFKHVYYDHYKRVPREDFIKILVRMGSEGYGAVLRKKDTCNAKIVTAIFDDIAEAHDEMAFELGSSVENEKIKEGSLILSKYQARIITLGIKPSRTEYKIYSLDNEPIAANVSGLLV